VLATETGFRKAVVDKVVVVANEATDFRSYPEVLTQS
jgi:hypothetical protein